MRWLGRIVLAGLVGMVAAGSWLAAELTSSYRGYTQENTFVDVPRGASCRAIGGLLEGQGVVRSRIAFEALCRWRSRQTLQAGEYVFSEPMKPREVFDMLAQGRVYVHTITVPEGWTRFEIAGLVEREGLASRAEFLRAAADPAPVVELAPGARNVEGFLFPATYAFPRHITPQQIIGTMVRRFQEVWSSLPQAGQNRDGLTTLQEVTLASLVERETSQPTERPLIAGVFYNRLRRHYLLECDPTVIYALELANRYDGTLHPAEMRFASPYNTYLHPGLPPGPIANPGEASLRAALSPAPVDYLYFVANTQGGHFFSRTLAEHMRNVARYRRLLAESAAAQADGGKPPAPAGPRARRGPGSQP